MLSLRQLETDPHEHGHEESPIVIQILVIFFLLLASLFVFLPYSNFMKSQKKKGKKGCCKGMCISLSSCFAAGMLLSIAILHILPEADANYGAGGHEEEEGHEGEEEEGHGEGHSFPVPFLLFLVGFMVMLLLDQVIFKDKPASN